MGWGRWITTCLAAALIGVCVGATYVAVNGHFDAPHPSGSEALPGPTEQATGKAPAVRLAPGARAVSTKAFPARAKKTARTEAGKSAKTKAAKAKSIKVEPADAKPVKGPKASGGNKPANKGK